MPQRVPDQPARRPAGAPRCPRPRPPRPRGAARDPPGTAAARGERVERTARSSVVPCTFAPVEPHRGHRLPREAQRPEERPVRRRDEVHAPVVDALVAQHQLRGERGMRRGNAEQRGAHAAILRGVASVHTAPNASLVCFTCLRASIYYSTQDARRRATPTLAVTSACQAALITSTSREFFAALHAAGISFTQVKCLGLLADAGDAAVARRARRRARDLACRGEPRRRRPRPARRGERVEDPRDRRSKLLRLTARGRRTLRALSPSASPESRALRGRARAARARGARAALRPIVERLAA